MRSESKKPVQYEVALSFAGEDRQIAEELAELLRGRRISVFYDKYEEADLWGKDLYDHLADIYSNRARFCIMLISANYSKKAWTNHERKSAQARAFREHEAYILPVRIDSTTIPSIPATMGYVDLRQYSVDQIANMVEQKLNKPKRRSPSSSRAIKGLSSSEDHSIDLPRLRKEFSQREKDKFIKESFASIKRYFKRALLQLEKRYKEIETDVTDVHNFKFLCKIYIHGDVKCQCRIWLGEFGRSDAIFYYEGSSYIGGDGSYNEYIAVEDNGFELHLKLSNMWFDSKCSGETTVTKEKAAEYLWKRFSSHLEH